MQLNNSNYFSTAAMTEYWSVSQFKAFDKCEAAALAELRGEYGQKYTTALLVGSYVDAYFSDELEDFYIEHPEVYNSRTGLLKADFRAADDVIWALERQPVMMQYMSGERQAIKTAELFGVPWKIKMDFYDGEKIVDLKVVRNFEPIYEEGFGMRSWIEYWGYDIQGAIYQKVEQLSSGRKTPLPFYLAAATKEDPPDVKLIQIPQHVLDTALKVVESKIDRFDLVKTGEIPSERCEKCAYCRRTKVINGPEEYEVE